MGSVMDQERPWEREEHQEAETMRERIKDRYRRSGGRLEPVMNQIIAELERIEALVTSPSPVSNVLPHSKCGICEGTHDNDALTDICTSCEARINEDGSP